MHCKYFILYHISDVNPNVIVTSTLNVSRLEYALNVVGKASVKLR